MAEEVKITIDTQSEGKGATQARKDIEDVGSAAENAGNKAKKASFDFKEFATNAGLGATAILGTVAAGIGFGAQVAGNLESARQGFIALLGSAKEADATMARIRKEAASTPFEIPGLVAGTQALAAITKDGDKAIDVLMNVGSAIATSGKGQAELDRVILNLQQVASTGKLTAMDIKQFQGAIPIFNDIVKGIGMTTQELQDSDNAAELLFLAFEKAAAKGGIAAEGFASQAGTFNQLVSNMKDNFTILAADLVTKSGVFDFIKDAIGRFNEALGAAMPKILEFINWLKGNQTALVAVAGVIGGLLVAALVAAAIAFGPIILAAMAFAAAGAAIAVAIQFLLPYIMQIWEVVQPVFENIRLAIVNFIETNLPAFIAFWDVMKGIFQFALGFIKAYFVTTWDSITQIFKGVMKILAGVFEVGLGVLEVIFGVFQGIFTGDWNKAWKTISVGFQNIWNGIKSFFGGIIDAILGMLKGFVNSFIGIINGVIGGVNNVASHLPGGKEGVKIPLIPHLAEGIENFKGGMALVGERGPELAILPRGTSVIPNNQISNFGGATINQTNNIYTPVDLDSMLRELQYAAATR